MIMAVIMGPMATAEAASTVAKSKVVLAFDFSDNSVPASVSKGTFHIIVNVLPEHTSGMVRIVASPPASMAVFFAPQTCAYKKIVKNQIKCGFRFTTEGVWSVHAQYKAKANGAVASSAVARLRVAK